MARVEEKILGKGLEQASLGGSVQEEQRSRLGGLGISF